MRVPAAFQLRSDPADSVIAVFVLTVDKRSAWHPRLTQPRLERKHATHQGLPGNPPNDPVYCYGRYIERKRMLETTHRSVCHWSKYPIDLRAFAGIAGEVAELKLLLHSFDCIAFASLFDLYDKS